MDGGLFLSDSCEQASQPASVHFGPPCPPTKKPLSGPTRKVVAVYLSFAAFPGHALTAVPGKLCAPVYRPPPCLPPPSSDTARRKAQQGPQTWPDLSQIIQKGHKPGQGLGWGVQEARRPGGRRASTTDLPPWCSPCTALVHLPALSTERAEY